MTTMYHGAHTKFAKHLGLCLTDDSAAAMAYGRGGEISVCAIDLQGLQVLHIDGYDRETNTAPGDDGDSMGADVLVYDDEDDGGHAHRTWRLMTDAALQCLTPWVCTASWAAALADLDESVWSETVDAWTAAGADDDDFGDYDGDLSAYIRDQL